MSMHILVVDDEPDLELLIRQRFRKLIRAGEMQFSFAEDGVEALNRLEERATIDLVLADINMPRMDGLTLLGRIGALERLVKVVIVSAYGDMENIRTAMNRGAFDFITKPIDFEDLEITIRRTYAELDTLKQAEVLQRQLTAPQRELVIASRIQLSSLPPAAPAFPEREEFDLYALMIPAREVGGDFYDYFLIDEHRLGFSLGDVSGKGVGAALFMAVTRTLLKATALQGLEPAECLCHVNRVLYPESMANMFVTLVYGVLDTRTGEVQYCNAGHNPPYLLGREGGPVTLERIRGIGLCLAGDFEYHAGSLTVQPGETLFFYTDGVTEAANGTRTRFSEERLTDCLRKSDVEAPAGLIRHVLRNVEAFTARAPPADDLTMLALRYAGPRSAVQHSTSSARLHMEEEAPAAAQSA